MVYQSFESRIEVLEYVAHCGSTKEQLRCEADIQILISEVVKKALITSVTSYLLPTQLKKKEIDQLRHSLVIKQEWTDRSKTGFQVVPITVQWVDADESIIKKAV